MPYRCAKEIVQRRYHKKLFFDRVGDLCRLCKHYHMYFECNYFPEPREVFFLPLLLI